MNSVAVDDSWYAVRARMITTRKQSVPVRR